MTTEVNLIPQLDDLVNRRQAKHNRARKERSEREWQSITGALQQSIDQPDDQRTDEHLDHRVRELIVLHWSKLPAIHTKEISQRVHLQREEHKSEQQQRNSHVVTNTH